MTSFETVSNRFVDQISTQQVFRTTPRYRTLKIIGGIIAIVGLVFLLGIVYYAAR